MSNAVTPFGLIPVQDITGARWDGKTRKYWIPKADSHQYGVGDPVASINSADTNGIPGVSIGVAGSPVRGVITAVVPNPGTLEISSIPAVKQSDYYVEVCDDPNVIFAIQEQGTPLDATATAKAANFLIQAPAIAAQVSNTVLDTSTLGTGNNLLLLGLRQTNNNTFGNAATWLVMLYDHELRGGGGGGSINLITSPTTLTVGASGAYTTFAAVIAYLSTCMLSGSGSVTVNYLDATCSEQSTWDLPFAVTVTSAQTVTVNTSGWGATYGMFTTNNDGFLLNGTWNSSGGSGVLLYAQQGTVINMASGTGWTCGLVAHLNAFLTHATGAISGGSGALCAGGIIQITSGSLTGTADAALYSSGSGGIINAGPGVTLTGSGTVVKTAGDGSITTDSCTMVLSSLTGFYYACNGGGLITANGDVISSPKAGHQLATSSGRMSIQGCSVLGGVTSTAASPLVVNSGGIIQRDGSLAATFTGTPLQSFNTATADGLLLGS